MRCLYCDKALTDMESKTKDKTTGEYLDLCKECRSWEQNVDALKDDALVSILETYKKEHKTID